MKRKALLIIGILAFFLHANASHIVGGDIQYRYVGDSTGVAHQYLITLRVYRDCAPGLATGISGDITITSSCYANQTETLQQIIGPLALGEFAPQSYQQCVNAGTVPCIAIRLFKGIVTLPGICADYKFYYQDCCRPGGISNLVNSLSQGFYFSCELNNFLGPNSSTHFTKESLRAFCVGQNAIWNQNAIDSDGDSLLYTLTSAKQNNGVNLAYAAGYTPTQPINTNPTQSFSLNSATGEMHFVPGAVGNYVIAFDISEFRYDSLYNMWILVGKNSHELYAAVTANCSPFIGVLLDYNAPGTYIDPQTGLPTIDYACNDSIITLNFFNNISCSSIASNASDFRLTDPAGQPLPLKSASTICNSFDESDSIRLHMLLPFSANGSYILYSKTGDDGNTIINSCGYSMAEFDTIQLKVSNCSVVSINENEPFKKIIIPNAYSPNGDGINDRFIIQIPLELDAKYILTIVNNMGQEVFKNRFSGNQNWEAFGNSQTLPVGMYYSILEIIQAKTGRQKVLRNALSIYYQ